MHHDLVARAERRRVLVLEIIERKGPVTASAVLAMLNAGAKGWQRFPGTDEQAIRNDFKALANRGKVTLVMIRSARDGKVAKALVAFRKGMKL